MKPSTSAQPTSKKPAVFVVVGLLVVGAVAVGAWMLLGRPSTKNYAEEVAQPIESALTKGGATKVCERGDGGRGSDNTSPWYQAYFKIAKNDSGATDLLISSAKDSGYDFVRASTTNRGSLSVGDKYIDKWFFNNTKVANPYRDLLDGSVALYGQVNAHGLDSTCSQGIVIDENNSAIGLEVRLPSFKR